MKNIAVLSRSDDGQLVVDHYFVKQVANELVIGV